MTKSSFFSCVLLSMALTPGVCLAATEEASLKRIEEKLAALTEKIGAVEAPKRPESIDEIPNSLAYRLTNLEAKVSAMEEEQKRLADTVERTTQNAKLTFTQNPKGDVEVLAEGELPPEVHDSLNNENYTPAKEQALAPAALRALHAPKHVTAAPSPSLKTQQNMLPSGDDVAAYNRIQKLIHDKKLDEAETALTDFLLKYPSSALKPNTLYWAGEVARFKGNNERAAAYYIDVYSNYPQHSMAPEALLKLAHVLKEVGKTSEAEITLEKIEKQYPHAPETIKKIAQNLKADILQPMDDTDAAAA